jgi:hypothetical protein
VDPSGRVFTDDSFDPVYTFDWEGWWTSWWFNVATTLIGYGFTLGQIRGLVNSVAYPAWLNAILGLNTAYSGYGVAKLAIDIILLINARHLAWYAFLFEEEFQ